MHISVYVFTAVTPLSLLTTVFAYPDFDENKLYTRDKTDLDDIWTRDTEIEDIRSRDSWSADYVDTFELLSRAVNPVTEHINYM